MYHNVTFYNSLLFYRVVRVLVSSFLLCVNPNRVFIGFIKISVFLYVYLFFCMCIVRVSKVLFPYLCLINKNRSTLQVLYVYFVLICSDYICPLTLRLLVFIVKTTIKMQKLFYVILTLFYICITTNFIVGQKGLFYTNSGDGTVV